VGDDILNDLVAFSVLSLLSYNDFASTQVCASHTSHDSLAFIASNQEQANNCISRMAETSEQQGGGGGDETSGWQHRVKSREVKVKELTDRLISAGVLITLETPDSSATMMIDMYAEEIHIHPDGDVVFVCNTNDGKQV
jgi:hypothetical protein